MQVLDGLAITYEIVAISDSAAAAGLVVADLLGPKLRVATMERNPGKGAALRAGLATGRGRYLGFIDPDGDLDPELLTPFLSLVELYQPDIVLGSKRHPLSIVEYPPLRRIYSVGYQILINLLFRLNIRDTQTGLKLVRREVLAAVLPRMVEKRFVFDLELFVVARRLGYRRFLEAPVHIREPFGRAVALPAVSGMLIDTMAVFYRLRVLRFYDRPVGWSPSELPAGMLPGDTGDVVLTASSP
jgi:glycosyltransferase involved in cell wall biosynthesis